MRIAIIAGPFLPIPPNHYGGIEQIIWHLIKGLKELGHTPILLAPGDSKVDCELIATTPQSIPFPRYKKDLAHHKKLVKQAEQTTAHELQKLIPRIDIIHSHGFDMKPYNNFPNVTTLHNQIQLNDFDYFLDRTELSYVTISKNQQAVCPDLTYAGVVYNGENPREFPIVQDPEDYVCFLGRFDRAKNPHLAIQLAISLGLKIKVAGKVDFAGEGYFEEEIEPYLNHKDVEYLGELNFEQKVQLLSNARCNLHPTNFREPFGLTVLEAAYCGTPTLAIARGSMPELIEPGRTGMLVEDFVEGRHLIGDCFSMDRTYIASRARQLFNYRTMANHYVDIYKAIINEYALHEPAKEQPYKRRLSRLFKKFRIPYFNQITEIKK
jgi:glycosyltransferase involved in cell wall biosynthesis